MADFQNSHIFVIMGGVNVVSHDDVESVDWSASLKGQPFHMHIII